MNTQGMTDIVGIFELFFSEDIVVKISEETIVLPNNLKTPKATYSQRDQGYVSGFLLRTKKYMSFLFYVNWHSESHARTVFC
jgi:hypothetical protein